MQNETSAQASRRAKKELARRLRSADPGLEVVHPDAAGIDVGNESHYVAVRPDRDSEPVRRFACFAISNHRLLAFDGERVTFRWKDYAHGGKLRKMTLLGTEFLRRFFLHVLPKGFVRIRYFGFLANRFRAHCLPLCQQFLASNRPPPSSSSETSLHWHCPHCGTAMVIIQKLTAVELALCSYFDSS